MNVKHYVRALLCLYFSLLISIQSVQAQSLKVGESLPPELWSMPLQVINQPQGKETITLSEYKDKLIILDFWATWCAPCIKSLTKLDTLQKQFGEQLAVIPVTYENADKVMPILMKKGWSLPSVVQDSLMKQRFPHRYLPHSVWIDKRGVVKAITGNEDLTAEKIKSIIEESTSSFNIKEDLMNFDSRFPLYVNANGGQQEMNTFYRSMLTGPVRGLGKVMSFVSKDPHRKITMLRGLNCDIAHLFILAYPEAALFPSSRIIADSKMAAKIKYTGKHKGYNAWLENNKMSYELNFPPTEQQEAVKYVAEDFKRYWGLVAGFEEREIDCMVITATERLIEANSITKPASDNKDLKEGYKLMNNTSVKTLTAYLNTYQNQYLYVNEIAEDIPNLDVSLPEDIEDTDELISSMYVQGIKITPERRKVRVLVIKDCYE